MARPRKIDEQAVERARQVRARTKDANELREALAILLPAEWGSTLEETAAFLGVSRATVPRLQATFKTRCQAMPTPREHWGGRRRALMTVEEEQEFLKPWEERAKEGCVLVVSPIRAALAQRLGRPVAASVVYRFLARHGWRKVAPDTRHPKSDPAVQEAWKKNSRKIWLPS
jgi:transposase